VSAPDGPLLRLDGLEPIGRPPEGRERALGRDPFDAPDLPDPVLEALALRERTGASAERRAEREPAPGWDPPRNLVERWMGPDVRRRMALLEALAERERGVGSFSPTALRRALPPFLALYRAWFRVQSRGHEHLPAQGPAILVANHAGLLPFDGAMATLDVLLRTEPPRLPRALFDRFVARLGPVRRFFEAAGAVLASREAFAALLREGKLVLVFPEGMDGIVKPVSQRYRLQHFHTGFVRQALEHRVPVIPVAIVGSDDQSPILYDLKPLARRLGLPVAPITPTFPWLGPLGLVPYPVRYRIVYGEPMDLAARRGAGAACDDEHVAALAQRVRRRVQHLLDVR
jgi:1-acyl-sn-glycerol-3-phosphate acyltransferase